MHEHEAAPTKQPSLFSRFVHHVFHMPSWHRYVLLAAIAVAAVGVVGHVRQFTGTSTATASPTVTSPQNGFASPQPGDSSGAADSNAQPWYLSPRFLSIGGSVVGGFIIGWIVRVFVKTAVLIGLLIAGVIGGLSYFHVMNVDFTSVQQQYSGDFNWLGDQAARLGSMAISYLPVHVGGLVGMFMGFRRTRI